MIVTIILVVFAVVAALVYAFTARYRAPENLTCAEILERLQPIHMPALENLIEQQQFEYLKSRLTRPKVTQLERKRARALAVYVRRIVHNSGVLMMCADAASRSENPELAAAGRELLTLASTVRIRGLYTLVQLYLTIAFPFMATSLNDLLTGYTAAQRRSTVISSDFFGESS